VMPCGFGVKRAVSEYRAAKTPDGWPDLPAVREGRVFAIDANSYSARPGPRLADGVALLAHLFHPDLFSAALPEGSFQKL
jgi:iron complex transport system substrate-binding protein